jgi:hypothetical protein
MIQNVPQSVEGQLDEPNLAQVSINHNSNHYRVSSGIQGNTTLNVFGQDEGELRLFTNQSYFQHINRCSGR